jgi:hypothetical protein
MQHRKPFCLVILKTLRFEKKKKLIGHKIYAGRFYIQKPVKHTLQFLDCAFLFQTCASEETKIELYIDGNLNLNCDQCLVQVFHVLEKQDGKHTTIPVLFLMFETLVLSEYNLVCKKL